MRSGAPASLLAGVRMGGQAPRANRSPTPYSHSPSSRPERSAVEGPPHFVVACSCSSFCPERSRRAESPSLPLSLSVLAVILSASFEREGPRRTPPGLNPSPLSPTKLRPCSCPSGADECSRTEGHAFTRAESALPLCLRILDRAAIKDAKIIPAKTPANPYVKPLEPQKSP